jgi:hypothetical protein
MEHGAWYTLRMCMYDACMVHVSSMTAMAMHGWMA